MNRYSVSICFNLRNLYDKHLTGCVLISKDITNLKVLDFVTCVGNRIV